MIILCIGGKPWQKPGEGDSHEEGSESSEEYGGFGKGPSHVQGNNGKGPQFQGGDNDNNNNDGKSINVSGDENVLS